MSELVYNYLWPWLEEIIGYYRVPADGPMDVRATAERIGLEVRFVSGEDKHFQAQLLRDGNGERRIELNSGKGSFQYAESLGHELGHYCVKGENVLYPGRMPVLRLGHETEELVCRQFGRDMALPIPWLLANQGLTVAEVANIMHVEPLMAFFQMWRARTGPKYGMWSGYPACACCENELYFPGCGRHIGFWVEEDLGSYKRPRHAVDDCLTWRLVEIKEGLELPHIPEWS